MSETLRSAGRRRNVLVCSGGKWVGIVLQLRQSMQRHPALRSSKIIVASSDPLTPAGCFADAAEQVPLIKSPDYISSLLDLCRRHDVGIVVPLIDLDLERLSAHLDEFADIGTTVVCAAPRLIELCFDKLMFAKFCSENSLEHARYYTAAELREARFPLFYKRRRGFGSIGSGLCQSFSDAEQLLLAEPDTMFQDVVRAPEVSADAYISRRGKCIVCVPRTRDKVVAGEAYKSQTMPSGPASDLARRTIAALAREGLWGPLNVQLFATDPPTLIEVNTRLGSASVLSNMAVGGRLLDAVLFEASGEEVTGNPDEYIVGLSLTRFLGDVFHIGTDVTAVLPPGGSRW